ARAIFLARDDYQRGAVAFVVHGGVVDGHYLAGVAGHAAFYAGDHFVLDADVREGAAHHDVVVASAGAIGIEVLAADLVLLEEDARGAVRLDAAGRGDVVGGDRIAQNRQRLGLDYVGHRRGSHRHALEIRGIG